MVSSLLSPKGYKIVQAFDGVAALDVLQARRAAFDKQVALGLVDDASLVTAGAYLPDIVLM